MHIMNDINDIKIFIVCSSQNVLDNLSNALCKANDNIVKARRFTSNLNDVTTSNYYLPQTTIINGYKNHAFVIINKDDNNDNTYNGIAIDEMYNSNIVCLNIHEFVNIPNSIFKRNDILTVWIDMKQKITSDIDFAESKYLVDRLDKIDYMYFYNDDVKDICENILKYIKAYVDNDEETKKIILKENS